jgi:hypothetical protein
LELLEFVLAGGGTFAAFLGFGLLCGWDFGASPFDDAIILLDFMRIHAIGLHKIAIHFHLF